MADLRFDEKLDEFRRSISQTRSAWEMMLETNEQKWQKQLEENNSYFNEIKSTSAQREIELTAGSQRKQKLLSDIETEIKNLNIEVDTLSEKLFEEMKVRKAEEQVSEEEIKSVQKEIEQIEIDARKRNRTREEEWDAVDSREKQLIDQLKVLQSRLNDERNHWGEILKMKEQDFTALKNELEQRMKDWQTEYHKKEAEVQVFRKATEELENRLIQLDEGTSMQDIKWRDQILLKQDEINTLEKDIALTEAAQSEEIKGKESAIESLKQEIERFLGDLSGIKDN